MEKWKKKKTNKQQLQKKKIRIENFFIAFFKLWPNPTSIGLKPALHEQKEGNTDPRLHSQKSSSYSQWEKTMLFKAPERPQTSLLKENFA